VLSVTVVRVREGWIVWIVWRWWRRALERGRWRVLSATNAERETRLWRRGAVDALAWKREVRKVGKTVAKGWILGISDSQYWR
jgi:hypothetical protein